MAIELISLIARLSIRLSHRFGSDPSDLVVTTLRNFDLVSQFCQVDQYRLRSVH